MGLFIAIALGIITAFLIVSYLIVQWHEKVINESRDRAIKGGCPYFDSFKDE